MSDRIVKIELEALQGRVRNAVRVMASESVPIKHALGRILAETVRANGPHPWHDLSAMDGFAVRSADIESARRNDPVGLAIVGETAAGRPPGPRLAPGCARRIMTGAPMPPGADCVVRVEDTNISDDVVIIALPGKKYQDTRRKGTDMRRGQMILRRGITIGPSEMAMLALLDCPRAEVYKRPRVGVISTGDELGEVGRHRAVGKIPDSNRYGLIGLVESAGCAPVDGGRANDNPAALAKHLRALAKRCDFIVTSGGVSAGDYDVVKVLFRTSGGVTLYRLPMKPGKPQAFGHAYGVPFFGLPGNPVSSMVVFDFLVRPALRKMAGVKAGNTEMTSWPAVAAINFPKKSRKWEFMRVHAERRSERWYVRPVVSQLSSNLKSMTDADGYVTLSPGMESLRRGDTVAFTPFPT